MLATDISRQALQQAERGIYSGRNLANVTPAQLETHFKKSGGGLEVRARLRRLISFAQMNLARSVYVGRMDCIFCMNVLMYFSEERRNELLQRFYDALLPGGCFFLGALRIHEDRPCEVRAGRAWGLPVLRQADESRCGAKVNDAGERVMT